MRLIWREDSPLFRTQNNHFCAGAWKCFVNVLSSKNSLLIEQSSFCRNSGLPIDEKSTTL